MLDKLGIKLYTAQQTRELDQKAISQQFCDIGFTLMQRAGRVAFNKIQECYPDKKNMVVICGQGNNGGDGFVIAKLAAEQNYKVTVIFLGDKNKLTPDSRQAFAEFQFISNAKSEFHNISYSNYLENNKAVLELFANNEIISNTEIFIDAIFGTGLNKEPSGIYKIAIEYLNKAKNANKQSIIAAVDIPSGLEADTGFAYEPTVQADLTITFIAYKQGLYTCNGPDSCGRLFFDSLGVEDKIYAEQEFSSNLLTSQWTQELLKTKLPARIKNSYKHQFGHVVIIGGGEGMPGAVLMAAQATMRTGAGLTTVITHASHSAEICKSQPEIMIYGVTNPDTEKSKILELINKATVVIIGPGLGRTTWSERLFNIGYQSIAQLSTQSSTNIPMVIDADGLYFLHKIWTAIKASNLILTPHPGEASVLLNNNFSIGKNRFAAVESISKLYNSVTVLKGVGSLICDNNLTTNNKISVCPFGNPGMATAGMGDILTGIIAGLLAQGIESYDATCLAVCLHALAADRQAHKFGERGLLATDILQELRKVIHSSENDTEFDSE